MGETRPGVDFAKAKNTAYSYWSPLRRARKRSEQLRPPSSSGLGHCPFTAAARVRIPLGVQTTIYGCQVEKSIGLRKQGPVAQLVSAPPCHGGGRGFKSRQGRSIYYSNSKFGVHLVVPGSVAQLVERSTENRKVTGSTPVGATQALGLSRGFYCVT